LAVLSRLLGVPTRLRHIWVLREKPLATTLPVHRCHPQATRELPGVVVTPIAKLADQEPEDPLLVPGVVHEPLDHKLGPTRLERVRDSHLRLLGSVCGVHRSRRHHVVATNPVQQSVLVNQVGSPVSLHQLLRSGHLRVELVLPGMDTQVHPITTGHRHSERADVLVIVPLVPCLCLGNRVPYLGEQGLERECRNASLASATNWLGSGVMPSGIRSREQLLRHRGVTKSMAAAPVVRCGLELYANANTETSSSQLSWWSSM